MGTLLPLLAQLLLIKKYLLLLQARGGIGRSGSTPLAFRRAFTVKTLLEYPRTGEGMGRFRWACCALAIITVCGAGIFYGTYWSRLNASGPEATPAPGRAASPLASAPPVQHSAASGEVSPSLPALAEPAPDNLAQTGDAPPQADAPGCPPSVRPDMPFAPSASSFTLCKLGAGVGPTLLIIGGIQGDEPGGFSAAALVASHYRITSGSVWVVPDLNFPSIIERNRGLFGDMNRKFAALDPGDPEYENIARIKSILLNPQVDLILNLHDGSGFYRPTWENAQRNPTRWGQSVIIDQEKMDAPRFSQLLQLAERAEEDANTALLKPEHRYHIHNTNTGLGDVEMEKTLSYFAVCNGKPAFGVEASKEFTTEYRSYYHLLVLESFMRQMGITYERDFDLTPAGVLAALNSNLKVAAYDNRLVLPLDNIRPNLALVPFKKDADPNPRASKPLLTLVREKDSWRVAYGNRTLTRLKPALLEFDDSLDSVEILLDGELRTVPLGEMVSVEKSFEVRTGPEYRVNAIGAQKEKNGTESGVALARKDFQPRFSVDKSATTYRVEVYKGKAFAGMLLVRFGQAEPGSKEPLTATKGPESALGF